MSKMIRPDFLRDVPPVVTAFKDACRAALGLAHRGELTPSRLSDSLAIDVKLAWKLVHLVESSDPFEAGAYVPGKGAFETLLKSLAQKSVSQDSLGPLRQAYSSFSEQVRLHAKSRSGFDALLAAQSSSGVSPIELKHRRAAFEANSYLWGIHADTQIKLCVVSPVSQDACDAAFVTGFRRLIRTRPYTDWQILQARILNPSGSEEDPIRREMIEGGHVLKPGELPLMTEFCSGPALDWETLSRSEEEQEHSAGNPVGEAAASHVFYGEYVRGAVHRHSAPGATLRHVSSRIRTPCRSLILDYFVHESNPNPTPISASLHCNLFSDVYDPQNMVELPLSETVQVFEPMSKLPRTPEVPPYRKLIEAVFGRTSWNPDEFWLYRLQVSYPPAPTTLSIHYPLPPVS